MKKVVLIGDSIRMGYDKYVKAALDGVAAVYYPAENCRFAQNVLRFAHEWKTKGGWPDDVDLVHWNAGLWDCLELYNDGPLTPLEFYVDSIRRIDKRLRLLFPKAKMVFATSTSVDEAWFTGNMKRKNSSVIAYNEAAVKILSGTDTVINELFDLTMKCPMSYHSDGVHFYTDEGRALIGGKVLSVICKELDIAPGEVHLEDFQPEKYTKENIGY